MSIDLLYKEEVYAVVGAAIAVHRELGSGFLEAVYQEAFEIELAARGIPFIAQHALYIFYKGNLLKKTYVADFFIYDRIIVEIKALDHLTPREEAQLLHYLKATSMKIGLLINFGSIGRLEWKRMALTKGT